MTSIEPGQGWEVYSSDKDQWIRAIVTKIDDSQATLRYEGVLEFVKVDIDEMQDKSRLFRPASDNWEEAGLLREGELR